MAFEKQRPDNTYIHIRINRKVSVAVMVSLLLHVLALWVLSSLNLLNPDQPPVSQTMVVQLGPSAPGKAETPPPPELPVSPPVPPRKARKPEPVRPPVHREPPRVIAVPQAESPVAMPLPEAPPKPAPSPPKTPALDPSRFPDMASYLAAVREQKRLNGTDAGLLNEDARERAEQANRPPKSQSGTNGVFQILSMDARSGRFSFRGWKNEFSYSHRETFEVFAGPDVSVERAMVRKMIEIIRRDYSGDFNWESPRFGRVIVLSARLQDNDGLEDFLIQEFFGPGGLAPR